MPRKTIERIREKIRLGQYDLTAHAVEEMAEDHLDVLDLEHAILHGQMVRTEKGDPRRTKYLIEGPAVNPNTLVGIVGRFTVTNRYLVITVFEIAD